MGCFSNGTEDSQYQDRWCSKCHHWIETHGCPCWSAHELWGNGECNKPESVLHKMIPRSEDGLSNKACLFFKKRKKCRLKPTDLHAWLEQSKQDSEVAKMESVPSFIRCYHAQQAIEKLLKAALIACLGEFKRESEEILSLRRNDPPAENFAKLKLPAGAWILPDKFPFTHDLRELWEKMTGIDREVFPPLSGEDKDLMGKATRYVTENRYPSYRKEIGVVAGYAPHSDVAQVLALLDKHYCKLRGYVIQRAKDNNRAC